MHANGYFQFATDESYDDVIPYVSNSITVTVTQPDSVWLPTINFDRDSEGLALQRGEVVTNQFSSIGAHVTTNDPVNHPAMIFDSANPTGGDSDLGTANQGNVLIISEDADSSDPDDNASGGTLIFTFDQPVMLDEVGLLDIDQQEATIILYDVNGNQIQTTEVAGQGDNSQQTVALDALGVSRMEIVFAGSGAVTDIIFCREGHPIDVPPVKFFVAEGSTDDVYRYTAAGEQINGFAIESTATSRGVTTTSDGSTAWIVKSNEWVYVHDGTDGSFQGQWDAVGPDWARGIATNDTDIWIVDDRLDRVYFYADATDWRSGSHQATSTFNLNNFNDDPSGIEVHGDTIWVTDLGRDQVFVYDLNGDYQGKWNLDSGNQRPSGITTDSTGENIWVTDYDDGKIYYYAGAGDRTSGSQSSTSVIDLPDNNPHPEGIADPVTPIERGVTVNGSISTVGEVAEYSFDAEAGDRIFFDQISGTLFFGWSLFSPSGERVFNTNFGDVGTTELPESGTYLLTVGTTGARAGNFSFQLVDVPATTIEPIQPDEVVNSEIETAGQVRSFSFDATAGDRVFFNHLSGTLFFGWNLVSPSGERVFDNNFGDIGATELSETGTYVLSVGRESSSHTGDFSFQLVDVPATTIEPIQPDEVVNSEIETAGQVRSFSFDATAGDRVFFNHLSGTLFFGWNLVSPSGERVFDNNFGDIGATELSETGTYVLSVGRGSSSHTGDFSFEVVAIAPTEFLDLEFDTIYSGTLPTFGALDVYSFDVQQPIGVYLDAINFGGGNLRTILTAPDGSVVWNQNNSTLVTADQGPIVLDQIGGYELTIQGVESYSFELVAVPETITEGIDFGQIVTGDIDVRGERNEYTFSGVAGEPLTLDLLYRAAGIEYDLIGPDGSTLLIREDQSATIESLPQSGLYTVSFAGQRFGGGTVPVGGYNFRILDSLDAPQVSQAADLVVTEIVSPQQVTVANDPNSSTLLNLSWTVTNQGNAATLGDTWVDRIYLLNDSTNDPSYTDLFLGEVVHSGELLAGESYVGSATFELPAGFRADFTVHVETDALNQSFENSAEDNNSAFDEQRTAVYASEREGQEQALINLDVEQGSIFPAGQVIPLTGQATTISGTQNVIFVIDVSASTSLPTGLDANFDGVVDELDNINHDSFVGNILDAELGAALETIERISNSADTNVGLVIFGNSSATLDLGPELLNQSFVDTQNDFNENGIADFEEALRSIVGAQATLFRPATVGSGTSFVAAVTELQNLLDISQEVDQTSVYFLTDGGGGVSDSLAQPIADAGINFQLLQIGGTVLSSGSAEFVAAVDSGASTASGTAVADPNDLTGTILNDLQITNVTVNGQSVELLDQQGNFSLPVSLAPGSNTFLVESFAGDRLVASEVVTLIGGTASVFDFNTAESIAAIQASYQSTTFNRYENQLHVGFAASNLDQYAYAADIGAAFEVVGAPAVSLDDSSSDGLTSDGEAFVILDDEIVSGILSPAEMTDFVTITIDNPLRQRFGIDVDFRVAANDAPFVTSTPILTAPADAEYQYVVTGIDFNGDQLNFSLGTAPEGLTITTIDSNSALLSWTPTAAEVGNHQVSILVDDGRGGEAEQSIDLLVPSGLDNQAPLITSSLDRTELLTLLDEAFAYAIEASDPEGDLVTLSLGTDAPAGATIVGNTLNFTPQADQVGEQTISIIASDPEGATSTQTLNLLVRESNEAPVFVSTPQDTAATGGNYRYQAIAQDADGDPVTYSLEQAAPGMTISPTTGLITFQPDVANEGQSYDIRVVATDVLGLSVTQDFTLTVAPDTTAPEVVILSSGTEVLQGDDINIQVIATDEVGVDSVEVTVDGVPVALSANNEFTYTATASGILTVVATVTDPAGNSSVASQRIRVIDPTDTTGPDVIINSPAINSQVTYLADVAITVTGEDLFEWQLEYALKDSGVWTQFAAGTDEVDNEVVGTFDPTILRNDQYDIRLSATDVSGNISTETIFIGVEGQAKIGNYALEFTDLTVPLAGIPIQITRQYDTLNANESGDFGFGWNLVFGEANIRETIPVSDIELAGVPPLFSGVPGFFEGTRVYVTTPEGQRVGFTFTPEVSGTLLGAQFTPKFTADVDTDYELEVPFVPLSQNADGTFGLYLFGGSYNPREYTLVSRDQIRYTYDQFEELQTVTDRNDVTLEYRDDGIFSSTGESIQFIRDAQGRITEIIDPAGNSLNYDYDSSGDLISYSDQVNNTWTHEYNVSGNAAPHFLERITGPRGNLINEVRYDEDGRFVGLVDALGDEVVQEFDVENNSFFQTDRNGNTTTLEYDDRGNVTLERDALGNETIYEYADPQQIHLETAITNARGFTTHFTYDDSANVTLLEEPGRFTRFEYDSFNNVTKQIGPFETLADEATARVTEFVYDANGNLVETIDALGNSSFQTNDSFGRPTSLTDRRGNTTTLEYAQLIGSPTLVTNPDLTTQQFTYDDLVRPLTQINELGVVVQTITYDDAGRQLSVAGADGQLTTYIYDGDLLLSETVRINATEDQVTSYEYDANNRLSRQTDGIGAVVELTYDPVGNVTSLKDPVGNITSYEFDEIDRQIQETDPLGNITTYIYDETGNLTEKVDRLGRRIEFAYDEMDRQTSELWYAVDGTLIETSSYTYDIFDNLLTASDLESSYTYSYDVLDRLLTSDNAGTPDTPNVILSYTYDVDGNRIRVADNSGVTIDSEYGSRNQLLSKTWFGGEVDDARIEYDFDAALREIEARRYRDTDGTTEIGSTETVYDDTGRRISITHLDGSDLVLANYEYEFDNANRITRQVIDDDVVDYTYDATGQLLTADHSDPAIPDEFYVYDLNGNRIDSHLHGSDYVTGPNNQLLSDGEFNYEYDDEGNQIRRTDIETGEVTEFEYDHRNRLIRAVVKSSGGIITSESEYIFDVFGRRIAVINDADGAGTQEAVRVNTVYDGDNAWADYNEAGESIARYLFGDSIDSNIARWRTGGEGTAWYLTDHLGTVRGIIGMAGALVNQTTFDSFGQVLNETDSLFGDRFKFTGRELNSGNDYFYRSRTYNARNGRFLLLDSIRFSGLDTNLYRYAGNSATNANDPLGTLSVERITTPLTLFVIEASLTQLAIRVGVIYLALFPLVSLFNSTSSAVGGPTIPTPPTPIDVVGNLIEIITGANQKLEEARDAMK